MQPRIIARSEHPISRKNIDADALKVLYRLYRSGHTAFLVGGGVRDLLIGRHPKDFDVSTSARPGQVKKLFRNCWLIGRRFRLAHIHFKDHKIVEVSTFRAQPERSDTEALDLLVRQDNTFGSPEEDALRRDFTINGLFYDIASFSLIDYVGGVEDIEAGVIRTIGEPHIRFQEDPVRMIRAIKFAARLDFAIEPATWDALCDHVDDIRKCSTSRVVEDVAKLLEGGAACRSLQLLKASGLLRIVLPEVYEYVCGQPAGPGLAVEGRSELPVVTEEELLLNTDEDTDREAQERLLGVEAEDAGTEEGGDDLEDDLSPRDALSTEVDVAVSEEDEIDLSDDEDTALSRVVTPQGTRCVFAPDSGALFWRTLGAVDERIRSGHPLTRPTLFAALYQPLVQHTAEWLVEQGARDFEQVYLDLLRPLTQSMVLSRRDRERVCQILAAQRKFRRNNRGFAQIFSRKPYFSEALDLHEIGVLATGDGVESIKWWRSRYPYVVPTVSSSGRAHALPVPVAGEGLREAPLGSRRRRRVSDGDDEGTRSALRGGDDEGGVRGRSGASGRGFSSMSERMDRDADVPVARSRSVESRGARERDGSERRLHARDFSERGGSERRLRSRDLRDFDPRDRREREDTLRNDPQPRDRPDRYDHGERTPARGTRTRAGDRGSRGARERIEVDSRDRGYREPARDDYARNTDDYSRGSRDLDARLTSGRDEYTSDDPYDYNDGEMRSRDTRPERSSSQESRSLRGGRDRRYRPEGHRGGVRSRDEMGYYEARVGGRDITPDTPRPSRDEDGRRGGRRRRRKPPL